MDSLEQARSIAALAQEKLEKDVVILDMTPVCTYTDYFVIATGQNPRQTKEIFDEVRETLKAESRTLPTSVDGTSEATWIVGDYLDVEELKAALAALANTAYGLDDELKASFGGARHHED